jgi:phage shock protein A
MAITRCILRWGLVSGLALGGATLLVGPNHMKAGFAHLQAKAQNVVDELVDDPIALRNQLEDLADQYPERIGEVRGEVAEVTHQIAQFERDVDIASRVVAMTTDDLHQLKTLVAQAEAKQNTTARPASFHFEGVRFNIEGAYTEAGRINHVRKTYQDRLAHDEQQLNFLSQQQTRLTEILTNLEDEFSKYQSQLWQLDRQIDAIERNERLIELMKEQKSTLASYDKFEKVGSLHQIESKLAELARIQEAQLQALSKLDVSNNYEKIAEAQMDMQNLDDNPFADVFEEFDADAEVKATPTGSVAFSN